MRAILPVLILMAGAALADPPLPALSGRVLSPDEFERYATGKTLAYAEHGTVWGHETYLPDRHVLWRALGDDCKLGHWWAKDSAICFSYDDGTASQCWMFLDTGTGLRAQFLNTPGSDPATIQEEAHPVPCPGPEIGS
jgi:hypothetical protein